MLRFTTVLVIVALCAGFAFAAPVTKTFGKAPSLTEATAISKLNSEPQTFVDKDVLVTGKVVNMCQEKGCWVEIEAADSSRILCKSFGDKVTFSKDVMGQTIQLQGKLVMDKPKAMDEMVEMKAEAKEAKAEEKAPKAEVKDAKVEAKTAEAPKAEVADAKAEMKDAKTPHACPVNKVMISIEGATVRFADKK
jgi:hypothetical protein